MNVHSSKIHNSQKVKQPMSIDTWMDKMWSIHTMEYYCVLYAKSLQSCSTLCDSMDCSLPGSSVCGIL